MVRVIEARIRLPIFSVKNPEAFQVRTTLPLPQPSTLVGVLTYCLGVVRGIGTKAREEVGKWVDEGKLIAARAAFLQASPPMATFTTVLRRFRVVDKAYYYYFKPETKIRYFEAISSFIKEDRLDIVKSILEKHLTDAFYREYVMGHEIRCVWVISEDVEFQPDWIRVTQRIGDTESLCTVLGVREVGGEVFEGDTIRTRFPACIDENVERLEGGYTIVKMCDEGFFHTRRENPRRFLVPCKVEVVRVRGGAVPVITPSEARITYRKPVKIVKTYEGDEISTYTSAERRRGKR